MASIDLAQLEQMFRGMREVAGWRTEEPLLWGYFFTDPDVLKLDAIADRLANQGYTRVGTYAAEDSSTVFLHVERVEVHTARSLDERNIELEALAKEFGISSYDGMDVGPVEETADRGTS